MKKYRYIILSIIITTTIFNVNNVFAGTFDANVTIKPSLTLDISSDKVSMTLDPASKPYDEQDLVITVGTNHIHGYKVFLSSNSTSLINAADSGKTIPTLPSTTPSMGYDINSFPANYWGYRLTSSSSTSSGNYFPFPDTSSSSLVVSEATAPVNNNVSALGFASKIDYTMPSGEYNLTLNFKVLPIVTQYYMQNLNPDVCTTEPKVVIDSRDNQTYTVSRLKDGKCWMTQNLRLGRYSSSLTLTDQDSNVSSSGFTLDGNTPSGEFNVYTIDGVPYQNNSSQYYCANDAGCYYNWYTATAGSGTSYVSSGDVNYSICPAGWALPTQPQAAALYSNYNSIDILLVNPNSNLENYNGFFAPGLTLGGFVNNSGRLRLYNFGAYWEKTNSSNAVNALSMVIDTVSQTIYTTGSHIKFLGLSVRCLLSE